MSQMRERKADRISTISKKKDKKQIKRRNKTLFALMTCNSYKSSMERALANEFTLQFAKSLLY